MSGQSMPMLNAAMTITILSLLLVVTEDAFHGNRQRSVYKSIKRKQW